MKIGVAGDPSARLSQLQTGSPHPLRLAWSMPMAGDAYAVEAEAHAMLDRHRLSGEWFAVPTDVAVAAVSGAAYRLGRSSREGIATLRPNPLKRAAWSFTWSVPFWLLAFSTAGWLAPVYLLLSIVVAIVSIRTWPTEARAEGLIFVALGWLVAIIPALVMVARDPG